MSGARPMTGVWGKVAFPQVSLFSTVASGFEVGGDGLGDCGGLAELMAEEAENRVTRRFRA